MYYTDVATMLRLVGERFADRAVTRCRVSFSFSGGVDLCLHCQMPWGDGYNLSWAVFAPPAEPSLLLAVRLCNSCLTWTGCPKASSLGLSDADCAALPQWPDAPTL